MIKQLALLGVVALVSGCAHSTYESRTAANYNATTCDNCIQTAKTGVCNSQRAACLNDG